MAAKSCLQSASHGQASHAGMVFIRTLDKRCSAANRSATASLTTGSPRPARSGRRALPDARVRGIMLRIRIEISQFALEKFANWTARQSVDDSEVGEALGLAEPCIDPILQQRSIDSRSLSQNDVGDRSFAPAF